MIAAMTGFRQMPKWAHLKTLSSQQRLGPSPVQAFENIGGLDSSLRWNDESRWFQEVAKSKIAIARAFPAHFGLGAAPVLEFARQRGVNSSR